MKSFDFKCKLFLPKFDMDEIVLSENFPVILSALGKLQRKTKLIECVQGVIAKLLKLELVRNFIVFSNFTDSMDTDWKCHVNCRGRHVVKRN